MTCVCPVVLNHATSTPCGMGRGEKGTSFGKTSVHRPIHWAILTCCSQCSSELALSARNVSGAMDNEKKFVWGHPEDTNLSLSCSYPVFLLRKSQELIIHWIFNRNIKLEEKSKDHTTFQGYLYTDSSLSVMNVLPASFLTPYYLSLAENRSL